MKRINLFSFTVKYFGFLKVVPALPLVFDSLLKLHSFVFKNELLDWLDEIETEVLSWVGTSAGLHKYGGLQFNYKGREIGHLHSNGLLDVLYNRKLKGQLIAGGRISLHHIFEDSGWISFYIDTDDDVKYAKELLAIAYRKMSVADHVTRSCGIPVLSPK